MNTPITRGNSKVLPLEWIKEDKWKPQLLFMIPSTLLPFSTSISNNSDQEGEDPSMDPWIQEWWFRWILVWWGPWILMEESGEVCPDWVVQDAKLGVIVFVTLKIRTKDVKRDVSVNVVPLNLWCLALAQAWADMVSGTVRIYTMVVVLDSMVRRLTMDFLLFLEPLQCIPWKVNQFKIRQKTFMGKWTAFHSMMCRFNFRFSSLSRSLYHPSVKGLEPFRAHEINKNKIVEQEKLNVS